MWGSMMRGRLIAAIAMLGATGVAEAATQTRTFDLAASNFTIRFGNPAALPVDPVHLNFTVTHDPAVDVFFTTSGLTINSLNLPDASAYGYSQDSSYLIIATFPESDGCTLGANSYCAFISNAFETTPTLELFYQRTNAGSIWRAQTLSLTFTEGVPEPAAWALMISGFAATGLALRRRRPHAARPATQSVAGSSQHDRPPPCGGGRRRPRRADRPCR